MTSDRNLGTVSRCRTREGEPATMDYFFPIWLAKLIPIQNAISHDGCNRKNVAIGATGGPMTVKSTWLRSCNRIRFMIGTNTVVGLFENLNTIEQEKRMVRVLRSLFDAP